MCFPSSQSLSNRGNLEAHHSRRHFWWSYAEEINFLGGCMEPLFYVWDLASNIHRTVCWVRLSCFSGTWPTVCCDGIALLGMGTNHIYQTVGNHVYNHSWIFQRNKNLYVLAMQWTVELFMKHACSHTKLNTLRLSFLLDSYFIYCHCL